MITTPEIANLEELKKSVPAKWINGGSIDFDELIYMDFGNVTIPTIQVSSEVSELYSNKTTKNIIDYMMLLHENADTLIKSHLDLNKLSIQYKEIENKYKEKQQEIENLKTKLLNQNFFTSLIEFLKFWFFYSK